MLVLRADPWMPEYGMGFDVDSDVAPPSIDPTVETDNWTDPRIPGSTFGRTTVTFVDGVRRAEVRLLADLDGQRGFGLFGSYAVGAVRCDGQAKFADHEVRRAVVLGSGLPATDVQINHGNYQLHFDAVVEAGDEPDAPLLALQTRMRETEAHLALSIAGQGDGLVLCDGPLAFLETARSPVIGIIKRFARPYLDADREALLPRLGPSQRTPLFGIADVQERVRRYSWYLRLAPLRPPWHGYAGLVRCEVSSAIAIGAAIDLADQVTSILPSHAGRPSDPRAPQNLAPVGGLETWLRHRMGDPLLIRRALLNYLCGN